jgi:polyphenol oxidase
MKNSSYIIELETPNIFPKDRIAAGVTKRNLLSFPPYGLSFSNAEINSDDEVEHNIEAFSDFLHIDRESNIFNHQIHSDIIRKVEKGDKLQDCDGMYTDEKGVILNAKIADCAAVLMYDSSKQCALALHSGWRGTKQKISIKGINILENEYSSNPKDILVYISPAAGGDVYEVGEEFVELFPHSVKPEKNGKYLYDNKHEIFLQLISTGILEKNIEISPICTIKNHEFHSFRRDKNISGRMTAFIGIKK